MSNTLDLGEVVDYTPTPTANSSINLVLKVVGPLSILGCLVNIALTLLLGKSKVILGKMVIMLAIFDLCTHIPLVLYSFEATLSRFTCEQIGSWVEYFGFASSAFFTTCFAHSLYNSLKRGSVDCLSQYFMRYIGLAITLGVVVGTSSVTFQFNEYTQISRGESFCQPRQQGEFLWSSLLMMLIPGVINIFGCLFYYIPTIRMLRLLEEKQHWGLLFYPLILVICISPSMVRRFYLLLGFNITNIVYLQISRGLYGAQGFLNSLAFGLSREICQACCPAPTKKAPESLTSSFASSLAQSFKSVENENFSKS